MDAIRQPANSFDPARGFFIQRFTMGRKAPQTSPSWFYRGTGFIQGYIKIGNDGAQNCIAHLLHQNHGGPVDVQPLKDGAYLFPGLPAGEYIVLITDGTGTWRAKAIHTVVP